ncbi:hypothetical protein ACFORJ_05505 [Corynebacterium hansenii]|uniref:Cobalamin biosynthesis protein CbiX n=1 Tax=Corynebacterium hansenii TaxID=394964 RepID=A0ABV7ZQD8_9CORY|nr:hypothetical protein [Corynebacterium hansenii]WJZ00198.1 hypothetical protein CHAN_07945 [Corynebacterium hansenii]
MSGAREPGAEEFGAEESVAGESGAGEPARIVLLAGPEVTDPGAWSAALPDLLPGRDAILVSTAAEAADAVAPGRSGGSPARPHAVVPLTTGRHPATIADAARALRWARDAGGARVCLSSALGDATRTVSALRANIGRHVPAGTWALVASTPLDAFADAELFRLARLAATHKSTPVEVAFDDRDGAYPTIAEGRDRCRALGAAEVRVLRADLTLEPAAGEVALWSPPVLSALLSLTTDAALDALQSGCDGIDAALDADHGHGYAHSHGHEEGHPHGHGHGHSHDHAHPHSHSHAHSHVHPHSHSHHGKGHRHG